MSRIQINVKVALAIAGVLLVLGVAVVAAYLNRRSAGQHDADQLRIASTYLASQAVWQDASSGTTYFLPLTPPQQKHFDQHFRDHRDAAFSYEPWEPDGDLVVRDPNPSAEQIIAYSLNLTPDRTRVILTADLFVHHVDDTQIDWALRQWIRH